MNQVVLWSFGVPRINIMTLGFIMTFYLYIFSFFVWLACCVIILIVLGLVIF